METSSLSSPSLLGSPLTLRRLPLNAQVPTSMLGGGASPQVDETAVTSSLSFACQTARARREERSNANRYTALRPALHCSATSRRVRTASKTREDSSPDHAARFLPAGCPPLPSSCLHSTCTGRRENVPLFCSYLLTHKPTRDGRYRTRPFILTYAAKGIAKRFRSQAEFDG